MTNAEARFNKSLRPRKPEGSLGRTAQDIHLDSHTAPELCLGTGQSLSLICQPTSEDMNLYILVFFFRCCFTSTETIRLIRDGEPRTATSTFTQLLSSVCVAPRKLSKHGAQRPQKPYGLLGTGRRGGGGYGGGGRGRLYTYRYTVTTRMASALRWAAMRAILMFQ